MNQWHQEPSPIAPAARCARSAPKRRARKKVTAAAAPWRNAGGQGLNGWQGNKIWDSSTQIVKNLKIRMLKLIWDSSTSDFQPQLLTVYLSKKQQIVEVDVERYVYLFLLKSVPPFKPTSSGFLLSLLTPAFATQPWWWLLPGHPARSRRPHLPPGAMQPPAG